MALAWHGLDGWRVWWLYPCGLLWGCLALAAPWQNYLSLLPRAECSAAIRGVLISLPQRQSRQTRYAFALRAIDAGDGWRDCRGKLLVSAPTDECRELRYGDGVQLKGAFTLPAMNARRGHGSYGHYLLSRGIRRHFSARESHHLCEAQGWRRYARQFREWQGTLGAQLCQGMNNELHAAMYRTMILGSGELPRDAREIFVRSGIVHVFSVSGMHVALMTSVWLLMLQALYLPFRWRWPLLVPAISCYVLLTGAAPAAARSLWMALTMIAAVCSFRPQSVANALGLSAWILLLANPLDLYHSGFVFSFTIVAVLLHGWPLLSYTAATALEKDLWCLRSSWRYNINRKKRALLGLLGGSALAWLGSSGLTIFYNGQLSWGGLLANLALPPFAALLMYSALPKIVLAYCCPPLSYYLGTGLDRVLGGMNLLACACAGPGLFQAVVPWTPAKATTYYSMLTLTLAIRRWPLLQWSCFALLAAAVAIGSVERTPPEPLLLCCQGDDGGAPALALLSARGDGVVVIYPGARAAAYELLDALANEGIACIDWLLIPSANRERQAADLICAHMPVRSAAIIPPSRPGSAAEKKLAALRARGINATLLKSSGAHSSVTWADAACLHFYKGRQGNEFTLHYRDDAAGLSLHYRHSRHGLSQLQWTRPTETGCRELRPALQPQCQRIKLKQTARDARKDTTAAFFLSHL
jgi:competence protein ComEC